MALASEIKEINTAFSRTAHGAATAKRNAVPFWVSHHIFAEWEDNEGHAQKCCCGSRLVTLYPVEGELAN